MNVFFLSHDPHEAAQMMHDKHVVKMILETAQILSAVAHRHGFWSGGYYAPTHQNHPCTLWAGDSEANASWLVDHGYALLNEYTHRYGKAHASGSVIDKFYMEYVNQVFPNTQWTPPAQAMPEQYRVPGNAVQAYRNYYLGEKITQSRWTRRPVPAIFEDKVNKMAKKDKIHATAEAQPAVETQPAATEAQAPAVKTVGVKGLKGVPLTAVITLIATKNPKRPGCAAEGRFALYRTGMTQQEFLDAGGTTPDLAYDTAHGFISVEGYVPPKVFTPREPKPKAEKAAKAPRAKKEKAAPSDTEAREAAAVEAEVLEETV